MTNERKYKLSLSHFEINVIAHALISHENVLSKASKDLVCPDKETREKIAKQWNNELETIASLEKRLDDAIEEYQEQLQHSYHPGSSYDLD